MAVLLTGADGFLGGYIKKALPVRDIFTLGLTGCDNNIDLSFTVPQYSSSFDKVIHAAGIAHIIPKSKRAGQRFFDVNVTGTKNLIKGLELLPQLPEIIVFISTIAVYGVESGENISEDTPLKGSTSYALSKIKAEEFLQEWGRNNCVKILILRLPLIAGSDPPGNLGEMIKAIKKRYFFRIGNGSARRSIVLAEDVASFIAKCNNFEGIYNLTDGIHPSVRELEDAIAKINNRRIMALPQALLKILAQAGDLFPVIPINSLKLRKLTSTLTFSDLKARNELRWKPRPVLENLNL